MSVKTEQRTCPEHGEYEARNLFAGSYWSGCPSCSRHLEEKRERERAEAARVERLRRQQRLLAWCGVAGTRYEGTTFDTFVASTKAQRAAVAACRTFAEDFQPAQGAGLFLLGPPGTGKTLLAATIAQEIIKRHTLSAEIVTARALIRRLRATWARGAAETEEAALEALAGLDLLVLDEIGTTTDTEVQQLSEVVDLRYQRRAPTVACSNLTLALLQQALGDRSFDRLREGAVTVVCNWESFRRPGGAA